jgi:probable F420-dependent oxidoreductase
MKFGVMFANTGFGSSPQGATDIAKAAEAGGFETLWTVEHVVVPSGYDSKYPYDPSGKMAGGAEAFDLPDPLIWLTYVAASTERIRLATGVLVLPQRNVVITAKEIATLDHLSSGRVTLGVGVGWLAEEFAALGVPFHERGARMDEYIDVLRELWAPSGDPEKSTVAGKFVNFADCIMKPRPANGTVPIVIGGHSLPAAKRAGRRGDGFFPGGGTIEELAELFDVVRGEAEAAGRDPDAISFYSGGGRPGPKLDARIEQLAAIGVTEVILPALPADELTGVGEDLVARFG